MNFRWWTIASMIALTAATAAVSVTMIATTITIYYQVYANVGPTASRALHLAQADVNGSVIDYEQIEANRLAIVALDADVTSNTNSIDLLQLTLSMESNKIATLQTDVAANDADIAALQSDVASNTAQVGALWVTSNATAADVAANDADIAALQSDVATNSGQISALWTETNSTATDVATNADQIGALWVETNATAGNVQANADQIGALWTETNSTAMDVATNADQIGALWVETNATAGDVQANADQIGALWTETNSTATDVATNANQIGALWVETNATAGNVQANADQIGALWTETNSTAGDVAINTAAIAALQASITANGTDIVANTQQIAALWLVTNATATDVATNTGDIATLQSDVATNAADIAMNNIYTYWVNNGPGVDAPGCGTNASPCNTLQYTMSIIPEGKSVTIALVTRGPNNPYTFDGTSTPFSNTLGTSVTFIAPDQLTNSHTAPFENWAGFIFNTQRPSQRQLSYYPNFGSSFPNSATSRIRGIRATADSANFNNHPPNDLICSAIRAGTWTTFVRYNPETNHIWSSGPSTGFTVAGYQPDAYVTMTNVDFNAPVSVYGINLYVYGSSRIRSSFSALQSRITFENDTNVNLNGDINFISSCLISGDSAALAVRAADISFSAGSVFATIGTTATVTANTIRFSESGFVGVDIGRVANIYASSISFVDSLGLGSIILQQASNAQFYASSIVTAYKDQGMPSDFSQPLSLSTHGKVSIEQTSFEHFNDNSTKSDIACIYSIADLAFTGTSCTLVSDSTTFDSAILQNGGISSGYGLYVNVQPGVTLRIAVKLINAASWTCSAYYSLNSNGTLVMPYAALTYNNGASIYMDNTVRLNSIDTFAYPSSAVTPLIYAMTTNNVISDASGGGETFNKYDLVNWAQPFHFSLTFNGYSKGLVPPPGPSPDSGDVLHADGTWAPPCDFGPWSPNITTDSGFAFSTTPIGAYRVCGGSGELVIATLKGPGSGNIGGIMNFTLPIGQMAETDSYLVGFAIGAPSTSLMFCFPPTSTIITCVFPSTIITSLMVDIKYILA
jgi:hypothetical protein